VLESRLRLLDLIEIGTQLIELIARPRVSDILLQVINATWICET
jgi:hypothetical protein